MAFYREGTFTAKDVVALVVLIACFVLKGFGANGTVTMAIGVIIAYYFGRREDYLAKKKL